ncbi:FMN-binding protein [Streptococcus agalactiae]|nr:FMN-binding protein [Streptococcus agalactiae]
MLNHKFLQVLKYEGVVSITSWTELAPHVTNTWNSYLTITDDQRILAPAAGMTHLENVLNNNSKIIMTLGNRESRVVMVIKVQALELKELLSY